MDEGRRKSCRGWYWKVSKASWGLKGKERQNISHVWSRHENSKISTFRAQSIICLCVRVCECSFEKLPAETGKAVHHTGRRNNQEQSDFGCGWGWAPFIWFIFIFTLATVLDSFSGCVSQIRIIQITKLNQAGWVVKIKITKIFNCHLKKDKYFRE